MFKRFFSKVIFIFFIVSTLWTSNSAALVMEKKQSPNELVFTFLNDQQFSCDISYSNSLCVITLKNTVLTDTEKLLIKNILKNEISISKFSLNFTKYDVDIFLHFNFKISAIYKKNLREQFRKTVTIQKVETKGRSSLLATDPLIIYYDIFAKRDSVELFTNQIGGKYDSQLKNAYPFFHFYDLNYSERAKNVRKDLNFPEEQNTPEFIWKYRRIFANQFFSSKKDFTFLANANILLVNVNSSDESIPNPSSLGANGKPIFGKTITIVSSKSSPATEAQEDSISRKVTNKRYGQDFYYGKRYFQNRDYDQAIKFLEKAIQKNEYSEKALQLLAVLYQTIGDSNRCESTYAQLLKDVNRKKRKSGFSSVFTLYFWRNIFNKMQISKINLIFVILLGVIILTLIILLLKKLFKKKSKKESKVGKKKEKKSASDVKKKKKKKKIRKKKIRKKKSKKKKAKKDKKNIADEDEVVDTDNDSVSEKQDSSDEEQEAESPAKKPDEKSDSDDQTEPNIEEQDNSEETEEKEKEANDTENEQTNTKGSSETKKKSKKQIEEEKLKEKIIELLKQGKSTDKIAEQLNIGVEEVRLIKKFNSTNKSKKDN